MIHVVVGILINNSGEILIAQRPQHVFGGGLWEFPGGKVEPNENAFNALQREFKEEIDIDIIAADPWLQVTHNYSERQILLDSWTIRNYEGKPRGAENQLIRWVTLKDLVNFEFPEGNRLFIKNLPGHN